MNGRVNVYYFNLPGALKILGTNSERLLRCQKAVCEISYWQHCYDMCLPTHVMSPQM